MEKNNNIKKLSPETSDFVEALTQIMKVESSVLSGLWAIYGDTQGDETFSKTPIHQICENLKDEVSKLLGHSIYLSLGDGDRVKDNIL